jgi:type II secretory pathway component PulK
LSRLDKLANRRQGQQGIALIVVLWILALLSVVVVTLSLEARTDARIARNTVEKAIAMAAADAGIQRAILGLKQTIRNPNFDGRGFAYVWRFGECSVHIFVRDEASKIDLNKAPEPLLTALFMSTGVDGGRAQSLADAIADFRDADNFRRPGGAETADYRNAGLTPPKNAAFESVEELEQVLGMTASIYRRIAPDLSIHAITSILPLTSDRRLITVVRRAGFEPSSLQASPRAAFSINATARTANGGIFVRHAVVQLVLPTTGAEITPLILSWEQVGSGA